ncbi:HEAT repeat domain-containing protein [Streptomyces avermitilis]
MAGNYGSEETPRLGQGPVSGGGEQDSFSSDGTRQFDFARAFGDLGTAFLGALRAMGGVGEGAEDDYQRALDTVLSYAPEDITRLVRRGWDELPENAYLDRWAVLQLLTDLRLPDAADVLADILATPIPPERSPEDQHRYSTVGQEIVIRTTAVEGLARLAAQGATSAVDTLVQHVDDEQRSIRAACVLALRDLPMQLDLPRLIRPEDSDLLEVHRYDVREVPQVVHVDHILYPGAGADVQPPAPR